MSAVVAYLRGSRLDADASQEALAEQRAKLAEWLAVQGHEVLQAFVELEGLDAHRPVLAAAIASCRQHNATLIVASTQPIAAGATFYPRIASVPVIVLQQQRREVPQTVPCPSACHDDVCLYVGPTTDERLPLYLCNPHLETLSDVCVQGSGLFLGSAASTPTGSSAKSLPNIGPRSCRLIELRNINLEGEFLDCLRIEFIEGQLRRFGQVYLRDLYGRSRPIPISFKAIQIPGKTK